MRQEVLDTLGGAHDFHALTKAVLDLCEAFGPVHEFRLVHNRRAARVCCFIELESPKQQTAMVRALGARSVNEAACFEIPVSLT
jgi:hypothetical protein